MEWILVAGVLCLSAHHGICVKPDGGSKFVVSGEQIQLGPFEFREALDTGETLGRIQDDEQSSSGHSYSWVPLPGCTNTTPDLGQGRTSLMPAPWPRTPIDTGGGSMRSAPYGMSKEEFGAFIEEHARKATELQIPRGCWNGRLGSPTYPPRLTDGICHPEDAPR